MYINLRCIILESITNKNPLSAQKPFLYEISIIYTIESISLGLCLAIRIATEAVKETLVI